MYFWQGVRTHPTPLLCLRHCLKIQILPCFNENRQTLIKFCMLKKIWNINRHVACVSWTTYGLYQSTSSLLYKTNKWPVLEYCVPVWHYALTVGSNTGPCCSFIFAHGTPYSFTLNAANLSTLLLDVYRWFHSLSIFSVILLSPSHSLLPPSSCRRPSTFSRLRSFVTNFKSTRVY